MFNDFFPYHTYLSYPAYLRLLDIKLSWPVSSGFGLKLDKLIVGHSCKFYTSIVIAQFEVK